MKSIFVPLRYRLPFNPPVYEMYNPYQREKFTENDPMRKEPTLSMLRVAWNLAWRENPDDVPEVTTENGDGWVIMIIIYLHFSAVRVTLLLKRTQMKLK